MAFRTNKTPAIEERSVSGSSVSFNSAFALPLKACKVSFSATQAGSGDPSPSNPRAISGVSAIGLTANSTPVSVSLGEERYGGELDVLTGNLAITHKLINLKTKSWSLQSSGSSNVFYSSFDDMETRSAYREIYISNRFKGVSIPSGADYECYPLANKNYGFKYNSFTTVSEWNTFINSNDVEFIYKMTNPITVQLSANELSSIIGNNTFSTDTGNIDLTYKDLDIAKRGNFREVFKLPN